MCTMYIKQIEVGKLVKGKKNCNKAFTTSSLQYTFVNLEGHHNNIAN